MKEKETIDAKDARKLGKKFEENTGEKELQR